MKYSLSTNSKYPIRSSSWTFVTPITFYKFYTSYFQLLHWLYFGGKPLWFKMDFKIIQAFSVKKADNSDFRSWLNYSLEDTSWQCMWTQEQILGDMKARSNIMLSRIGKSLSSYISCLKPKDTSFWMTIVHLFCDYLNILKPCFGKYVWSSTGLKISVRK
jgi:hypothetical protein